MAFDIWLGFFAACWVISLSPGAGAIASMSSGLQFGFRRGYWNVIGLQLALALQILIVAAGVGAVLATSADGIARLPMSEPARNRLVQTAKSAVAWPLRG